MPTIETYSDMTVPGLSAQVFFYCRDTGAAGVKDRRFAIPAFMRSLFASITYVDARTTLGFLTATAALDFPSIAAAAKADLTIAVPGAAVGDAVMLGLPAAPAAGLIFNAFVSAAGVVTVRASNTSSGAVDEASMTFRAVVIKST